MKKNILNSQNIISQDKLRWLESLCTAEDPPACTASCPLHLDVRKLCDLISNGELSTAFKMYQKAIPFPRIIAHTCDAPCKSNCKKVALGGAVEIAMIEQALVLSECKSPKKAPMFLSKKSGKIAIIGGNLKGMTAADYLLRKGYKVTIFEKSDALGGYLRNIPSEKLPTSILAEEIDALVKLGLQIECEKEISVVSTKEISDRFFDEFDAVFVACKSQIDDMVDGDSLVVIDEKSILAGCRSGRITKGRSSIYDVYDGRSAGISIDRILQNVSIMAGRESEGSCDTKLFTDISNSKTEPTILPQTHPNTYTISEAQKEASRCIQCQCLECVKKCGFLQHYGGNPRRYVREVYNNLSIAMGNHLANSMINSCAECSQCEAVCPNGLDLAQVFLAARERMVETEKMPQSAHEFALLDMNYSMSDAFFMAKHQYNLNSSEYVFFPGCQLPASEPDLVKTIYSDLCDKLDGGVGLMLGCCGIMAHWSGDKSAMEKVKSQIKSSLEKMGFPKIITACPSCDSTFTDLFGIQTISLFDILANCGISVGNSNSKMVLHHACGARYNDNVKSKVKTLALQLGITLVDGTSDTQSPCCGYGGLVPFVSDEIADKITDVAASQLDKELPILNYCVNCRDRYLSHGRDAYHILELCYPQTKSVNRRNPTWSQRQENRAALKRELLGEIWQENIEWSGNVKLYIDDSLALKLDKHHILNTDIIETINHAEKSGEKLLDKVSGNFTAYHRPANVTFWVEYSKENDGWRIHNAYSHRMAFVVEPN